MKVWAEHQKSQGADGIKCPMCREDFGPMSLLQQVGVLCDEHDIFMPGLNPNPHQYEFCNHHSICIRKECRVSFITVWEMLGQNI